MAKILLNKKNIRNKYAKIDLTSSMFIRLLHQEVGVTVTDICRRFPQFAKRSVYRHAAATTTNTVDGRHKNKGRPKLLCSRDERLIIWTLKKLRKERAAFSAKRIQEEVQLHHVSLKTIYRVLRKNNNHYRQSRKKGLLSPENKKKGLKFARKSKNFPSNFWKEHITFYFDGVGFAHKTNPYAEARAVSSMTWRKPGEGLSIATKGSKERSCGQMAQFYVAIAYRKGVVMCNQYHWRVTGE